MKFIVFDVPAAGVTPDQYHPYLLDEVKHGWQLFKDGVISEIFARQDRPGVAIIAESTSLDTLQAALDGFPLAREGMIGWQIVPIGPFCNWEMLFG